LTQLQIAIVRK